MNPDDLAHDIRRHRALYAEGRPVITDYQYDKLEEELHKLAPDHPVFSEVGPPDA